METCITVRQVSVILVHLSYQIYHAQKRPLIRQF